MTFADLVNGDSVFLDANTLIYYFGPHPQFGPACHQLVHRIENQELLGSTSTHILTEVAHRLMTFEAATLAGWSSGQVTRRLRQQPATIQNLAGFRVAIESIFNSRIQILSIPAPLILSAVALSQQIGLLSNDALIVAVMQANGLTKLASHDSDFDRVPGLTRYAPA
ncbi:MAG: type II toxin-antitoxin system VapC family toxin [Isosphaeraceae bacterium]